jgi:hypothetical protein
MPVHPPGPFHIDGVAMPTWILRYDKRGACSSPLTRAALLEELRSGEYTDVFGFSHGWNNDFDDAIALYREFLQKFETAVRNHPPARPFKPLFFGIVWPSTWLDFDKGPTIAAAPGSAGKDAAGIAALTDEMADRLESSQAELERFYALMQKDTVTAEEAAELARIAVPAFTESTDDENGDGVRNIDSNDLVAMMRDFEKADTPGGAAPPDLNEWGGIRDDAGAPDAAEAAGIFSKLDPRNLIRGFSVYQMKDRAGTVGYHGMASLLRDVLKQTKAKVHGVGHSYGCKVMLSGVCEPSALERPLDSVLLLEPAVSHLCFAATVPGNDRPGGYRGALDAKRVSGPILSTYSKKDDALHDKFHLALRRAADLGEVQIAAASDDGTSAGKPPSRYAALGGYGPRGANQQLVDPLPAAGAPYPPLPNGALIGFDGSNGVISSHGDVRNDATAWALYQLVFRAA